MEALLKKILEELKEIKELLKAALCVKTS